MRIRSSLEFDSCSYSISFIVVKERRPDEQLRKPCEANCTCLDQIKSDMRETVRHFSSIENPPEEIAAALFECFAAMQSFNYDSKYTWLLVCTCIKNCIWDMSSGIILCLGDTFLCAVIVCAQQSFVHMHVLCS